MKEEVAVSMDDIIIIIIMSLREEKLNRL